MDLAMEPLVAGERLTTLAALVVRFDDGDHVSALAWEVEDTDDLSVNPLLRALLRTEAEMLNRAADQTVDDRWPIRVDHESMPGSAAEELADRMAAAFVDWRAKAWFPHPTDPAHREVNRLAAALAKIAHREQKAREKIRHDVDRMFAMRASTKVTGP